MTSAVNPSSFLAVSLAINAPAGVAIADNHLIGHWEGAQSRNGEQEPLVFDFSKASGALVGTIGFPRRGLLRYPLAQVEFAEGKLQASYGRAKSGTRFDAVVDGDQLKGKVTSSDFEADLSLRRIEPNRPYREEKVEFHNGDVMLAGTLYVPEGDGPHPALVFVEGSGNTNRPYQSFYADHFARLGVGCLFYDKRGCGQSGGNWRDVGFWELAEDANAALELLKSRKDIDPQRIGMWGISQAGWILPMAASRSDDIAFLIIISGGAVTVAREGHWDVEYWLPKEGFGPDEVAEAIEYLKFNDEMTRTGEQFEELKQRFKTIHKKPWIRASQITSPALTPPGSWYRRWYGQIMDIDHLPFDRALEMPVLWVYGEDDNTFPSMEAARAVGNINDRHSRDFTVVMLPETGHSMRKTPSDDAALPFRMLNEKYLHIMDGWIHENVTGKQPRD